jgi:hypothetical protein
VEAEAKAELKAEAFRAGFFLVLALVLLRGEGRVDPVLVVDAVLVVEPLLVLLLEFLRSPPCEEVGETGTEAGRSAALEGEGKRLEDEGEGEEMDVERSFAVVVVPAERSFAADADWS